MAPFDYLAPRRLNEAIELAENLGEDGRFLAGGTDLSVGLRQNKLTAKTVIDLKHVKELQSEINLQENGLRISAATTMVQLEAYLSQNELFPSLQAAAAVVGSIQIRNRATVAGNICNASPAADTVPVLAALGAVVEIVGPDGPRQRLVEEFIQGNRQIDLRTGELVMAVTIPRPQYSKGCAFDRITRRRGVDLATTNMCCTLDEVGETIFAFGAVSPRPLVVRDRTGVLANPDAPVAQKNEAIEMMISRAAPISDVRASADYRKGMLRVMAERSLRTAFMRLQEVRGNG